MSIYYHLGLFAEILREKHIRPAKTPPKICVFFEHISTLKGDNNPDGGHCKANGGRHIRTQCPSGCGDDFSDVHAENSLLYPVNNKPLCDMDNKHPPRQMRQEGKSWRQKQSVLSKIKVRHGSNNKKSARHRWRNKGKLIVCARKIQGLTNLRCPSQQLPSFLHYVCCFQY